MSLVALELASRRRLTKRIVVTWLSRKVTLLWAVGLVLVGCGAPWKVVKVSGPPSALTGAGAVAIQFDYSTLLIEGMTQEAWVAQQKAEEPEYERSWNDLKARLEEHYVQGFQSGWGTATLLAPATPKPKGTVLVLVKVNKLQMRRYNPIVTSRSYVTVNVIWDAEGPADEIVITGSDTSTPINASIFQHVGHIGEYLGKVSAQFLSTKQ